MQRVIVATLVLSSVPLLWADKKPGRNDKGKSQDNPQVSISVSNYRLPPADVVILTDHYRGQSLPPGLAKKLQRGGSLPPGWQKKIQPIPVLVEQRLVALPAGYRRGIIDGAFVVYEPNGGMIVDVMMSFGR